MMMYRWKWADNPIGVNILDLTKRQDGYYIVEDPRVIPYAGHAISDWIKVNPGEVYRFTNDVEDRSGWALYAGFSKEKELLIAPRAKKYAGARDENFTIPDGVYWIRMNLCKTKYVDGGAVITLERVS